MCVGNRAGPANVSIALMEHSIAGLDEFSPPTMKQVADWNVFREIYREFAVDRQVRGGEPWNRFSLASHFYIPQSLLARESWGCQRVRVRAASWMDFDQALL